MQTRQVRILSTGKYLPKNKVTAEALADRIGVSADWVEQKSGVLIRHFVADETASQMGAIAARQALEDAGLSLTDIDCLVCTSGTVEQPIPCTAALIQKALGGGNSGIPAFDINSTCLSFVTGLDTLSYLVDAGRYNRVLLVATDIASVGLDWQDKESCTLFGDGAAAVIIERSAPSTSGKILCSRMETYSKGSHLSEARGGGSKLHPREHSAKTCQDFVFSMDGRGVYRLAHQVFPGFLERLLTLRQLKMTDMDLVIPHQASLMAMNLIRKQLAIPEAKLMTIVHNHGNTIAASIPMALHEAIHQRCIQRGSRVLLLGTSAGFSIGGLVFEF